MYSHARQHNRARTLYISHWAGCLVLLASVVGCSQPQAKPAQEQETAPISLDLIKDGEHTSGAWTYTYSISSPGTKSEGYHGVLAYKQSEVPAPMRINDYYETPWGKLYWVGKPVVLFGSHGWVPKPVGREPPGSALIDPAIVHSERFMVHIKIVTPEELGTPDRLEGDSKVLDALKPFGPKEVHVQSKWFPVGADPITLHDTKRWGTLNVCRSDTNTTHAPTLEFKCTNKLGVDTAPKPPTMDELMATPGVLGRVTKTSLSPEADALQPIQCTLSPFIGDPLVLYVICRIEDQGPKPSSWKVPSQRVYETGEPSQPNSASSR